MGRQIIKVPAGFQHPTGSWEPIPGAHLERLHELPIDQLICLQVYKDVSEGTPVSPIFNSIAELRQWLIEHGAADWAADEFIEQGAVPSYLIGPDGVIPGWAGTVSSSCDAHPGAAPYRGCLQRSLSNVWLFLRGRGR
jgi:hypothetical protein